MGILFFRTFHSSENSPFFSFAWPFVIGLKILRHFLIQSEVKPEPVATRSYTFSRALYEPRVFVSSFHQFTGLSLSFVVSRKKKSIFGSRALDWKSHPTSLVFSWYNHEPLGDGSAYQGNTSDILIYYEAYAYMLLTSNLKLILVDTNVLFDDPSLILFYPNLTWVLLTFRWPGVQLSRDRDSCRHTRYVQNRTHSRECSDEL